MFNVRTHAAGGVSEGAPFGFLSHGVGGQFMALLALRLKQDRVRKPNMPMIVMARRERENDPICKPLRFPKVII